MGVHDCGHSSSAPPCGDAPRCRWGQARADARTKQFELTAKGRRQLDRLHVASDAKAHALVGELTSEEQARLCSALAEVQRLLNPKLEIVASPADSVEARTCLNAYFAELGRRFPNGFDPDESVSAAPDELSVFLVVRAGGRPRGCGALKRLKPGVAEIKRMWVHPEIRRRGVGRRLLAALEGYARGCHTLRLDTSEHLPRPSRCTATRVITKFPRLTTIPTPPTGSKSAWRRAATRDSTQSMFRRSGLVQAPDSQAPPASQRH